jgi:hypothetical protein
MAPTSKTLRLTASLVGTLEGLQVTMGMAANPSGANQAGRAFAGRIVGIGVSVRDRAHADTSGGPPP